MLRGSKELGFLTGEENRTMNDAHVYGLPLQHTSLDILNTHTPPALPQSDAAMVVGEPFSTGTFNFASQKVTQRVHELVHSPCVYPISQRLTLLLLKQGPNNAQTPTYCSSLGILFAAQKALGSLPSMYA